MSKKQKKNRNKQAYAAGSGAKIESRSLEELELLDLNEELENFTGYWYDGEEKEEIGKEPFEEAEKGEEGLEYLEQEIFGYFDDDLEEEDDYQEATVGIIGTEAVEMDGLPWGDGTDGLVQGDMGGSLAGVKAREGSKETALVDKPGGDRCMRGRHRKRVMESPARRNLEVWERKIHSVKKQGRKHGGMMNRMLAGAAALVMVFAITAGSFYVNAKTLERQVASFGEVGSQMEGIEVIGEGGLLAMADAQSAKAVLEEVQQAESENESLVVEYEEKEWKAEGAVKVEMRLSSVQKDLKIKFVNAQTGKLIPNVVFEVNVTGADKKSYVLKDEDMDGVIYAADVVPGKCTVAMNEVPDGEDYEISTQGVEVTVKDKIEYKKVDVADEVKKESEVNAAIEDTGKKETAVESVLTDTVGWTESTKTSVIEEALDGEYEEVPKDKITDPMTVAMANAFMKFAAVDASAQGSQPETGNGGISGAAGEAGQQTEGNAANGAAAGNLGAQPDAGETGTAGNPGAQPDAGGIGTVGNQETQPDAGDVTAQQPGNPIGNENGTAGQEIKVSISQTALEMKTGESIALTAATEPAGNAVAWESSNGAVAAVNDGTVTAVGVGTAEIAAVTATGHRAACTVMVVEAEGEKPVIVLSSSSEKVFTEKTVELKATVSNAENQAVIWQSDNEAVASVSADGKVTGISSGAAVITALWQGDSSVSASCEVTVKENPEKDTVTKLVDNDGNQLYVAADGGKYREAVYADYYTSDKFYKKTGKEEYKYTGWQTIDGKTYYFDENGNKVTGEQIIQGAKYNFDSEGVLSSASGNMGIDVSKWNGNIDWNAVKNSGVSYVIIRCGYRGSTTGALIEDPKFRSNIQGATAAGLKVGVYYFTQAVNEVEAVEEASMVASLISGYKISYPVFLDVEPSGGRADGISRDARTAVCRAFCQTMQNSGYTAGIYANKTWLTTYIDAGSLSNYKIWLAQYAAAPTYSATRYDIWQYSASGSVGGISGKVDMNISYLGY